MYDSVRCKYRSSGYCAVIFNFIFRMVLNCALSDKFDAYDEQSEFYFVFSIRSKYLEY